MATIHVGEINSRVQTTDSQALLSPPILEKIVEEVLKRLREEQAHAARVAEERQLRSGVSASQSSDWE